MGPYNHNGTAHRLINQGNLTVGAHVRIRKETGNKDDVETCFAIVLTCNSCNNHKLPMPICYQALAVRLVDPTTSKFYGDIQLNLDTCETTSDTSDEPVWTKVFVVQKNKKYNKKYKFKEKDEKTFGSATWKKITGVNVQNNGRTNIVEVTGEAKFPKKTSPVKATCKYNNDEQNYLSQLLLYMMDKLNVKTQNRSQPGFCATDEPVVVTIHRGSFPGREAQLVEYRDDPNLVMGQAKPSP